MSQTVTNTINIRNRDEFTCFVPSPIEPYRTKTRIKSVRFKRVSPDEQYAKLREKGKQIDIVSPDFYVNGKKPMDGIFSPKFGADSTQDTPIYTCDCGNLQGGHNMGRVCPDCHTECRTIETDLRITGHIDIAPYHILTHHGYVALSKVVKNLDEILTTPLKIGRSGKVLNTGMPTILDLYDDYEELYEPKTHLPKKIAWMTKIPVYSSRLRPLMHEHTTMSVLEENKKYLSILKLMGNLKSTRYMPNVRREVEIQRTLNQLQEEWLAIVKIVAKKLDGKDGAFRRSLASGRLDFSSRLVISLGTDLRTSEVDIPASTFMLQYEAEIVNFLVNTEGISVAKAISLVDRNIARPSRKFVNIMNRMLEKNSYFALVNRNPTISESGIIMCRIRQIHRDLSDMTLKVPVDVLAGLAADFDGDQCTLITIKNPRYVRYFMPMCAAYAFIDRADGRYSKNMDFKKDYAALISAAWSLDTAYDNYLMSPDADSEEALGALGIGRSRDVTIRSAYDKAVTALYDDNIKNTSWKDRYRNPFFMYAETTSVGGV